MMHSNTTRWRSRTALSTAAAAVMLLAAPGAQADEQTVKLIQLLIQKGILTSGQAGELLRETGAPAKGGKRAKPAQATSTIEDSTPPVAKPGEIRVTYVPQFVRKQIADEVRAQVMNEAQEEHWAAPDALPEWTKRFKLYGNMRLRYESDLFNSGNYNQFINFASINNGNPFDIENYAQGNAANPPFLNTTEDRNRFRLRARIGLEAKLDDTVTANIRLGTGSDNGPVSTNATLGSPGEFSKYAIYLDRAFISFKPTTDITIDAGRDENPFFTGDILFYDQLGFDGASAQYKHAITRALSASITGGAFPVFNTAFDFSTNSPTKFGSTDGYLFAAQGKIDWRIKPDLLGQLGIGFFDFSGVQGAVSAPCANQAGNVYYCNTDSTRFPFQQFGNTVYAIRNIIPAVNSANNIAPNPQYFGLASRFAVLEVHPRVEISTYDPLDIALEGEFIKNLAYNRNAILAHGPANGPVGPQNNLGSNGLYQGGDTGYMVKGTFGHLKLKKLWDWNVSAAYRYIETDATVDALNDSEFHLGGTNARGYVLSGAVGVANNTNVSLKWLSSQVVSGPQYGNDVVLFDLNASF